MNGPFRCRTSLPVQLPRKKPVRIVKVTKPSDGQAITVDLGYEQQAKLDLTAVANEKMTLVHIGEKLIILFDNNATVRSSRSSTPWACPGKTSPLKCPAAICRAANSPRCSRSPRIRRCCRPRDNQSRLQAPTSATHRSIRC